MSGLSEEAQRGEKAEQERQAAIVAGWHALEAGLPEAACPYPESDRRRDAWLASYRAARVLATEEQAADAVTREVVATTERVPEGAPPPPRATPELPGKRAA